MILFYGISLLIVFISVAVCMKTKNYYVYLAAFVLLLGNYLILYPTTINSRSDIYEVVNSSRSSKNAACDAIYSKIIDDIEGKNPSWITGQGGKVSSRALDMIASGEVVTASDRDIERAFRKDRVSKRRQKKEGKEILLSGKSNPENCVISYEDGDIKAVLKNLMVFGNPWEARLSYDREREVYIEFRSDETGVLKIYFKYPDSIDYQRAK